MTREPYAYNKGDMDYRGRLLVSKRVAGVLYSWVGNLKDGDFKMEEVSFSSVACLCRVTDIAALLYGKEVSADGCLFSLKFFPV